MSRSCYFAEVWPEDGGRPRLVKLTPRMRGMMKGLYALGIWAQRLMAWPEEYNGAAGKVGEWPYESDVVHRAAKHPKTNRYGYHGTPTSLIATACQEGWTERPRRTNNPTMVTCEACLKSCLPPSSS